MSGLYIVTLTRGAFDGVVIYELEWEKKRNKKWKTRKTVV